MGSFLNSLKKLSIGVLVGIHCERNASGNFIIELQQPLFYSINGEVDILREFLSLEN